MSRNFSLKEKRGGHKIFVIKKGREILSQIMYSSNNRNEALMRERLTMERRERGTESP